MALSGIVFNKKAQPANSSYLSAGKIHRLGNDLTDPKGDFSHKQEIYGFLVETPRPYS